jgi:Tol biopolymer transport system component
MVWSNNVKKRWVLIGIVAIVVLGDGRANADFTFGIPTTVPNVNSSSCEACVAISTDGLELYFMSSRPYGGDLTYGKLWVARREATEDGWSEPVNLGPPVNSSAYGGDPSLSGDDLQLYFNDGPPPAMTGFTHRLGGYGGSDLWVSTRATKNDSWDEPENLGPIINTSTFEGNASLTPDGLQMFFSSNRPGGYGDVDIYVTTRATTEDPWSTPVNLGPIINTSYWDSDPEITADGLTLLFSSWRSGGYGGSDLWMTKRASTMDPWSEPINLGPIVNTTDEEGDPSLLADGSTLYFGRGPLFVLSPWDLWQASIEPIVDLNDDGVVDAADMVIMVDHWGTDDSLCDIGPMPWGDGVVDVQDLIVLAEHLFETTPGRHIKP